MSLNPIKLLTALFVLSLPMHLRAADDPVIVQPSPTPQSAQAPPKTAYSQFYDAMLKSRFRAFDIESRGQDLKGFPTIQSTQNQPFTRFDFIPVGQRSYFPEKPAFTLGPIRGNSAGLLEACLARPDFASLAIQSSVRANLPSFYSVDFFPADTKVITAGAFRLELTPGLLEYFSVSHIIDPPVPAARLAVVIHDPHSSRAGRFRMVAGFKRLIPEPLAKPNSVIFLVEGQFHDPDRVIRITPWEPIFGHGPAAEPLMRELLFNFVLDGPFVTRTLRQADDIPSFAIDDSDILEALPHTPDLMDLRKRILASKMTNPEKQAAQDSVNTFLTHTLNASEIEKIIAFYSKLAQQPKLAPDVQQICLDFVALAKSTQTVLKRNPTMAAQINTRMQAYPEAIPYIFMGNAHTNDLLGLLRAAQPATKFVVLDIREQNELPDRTEYNEFANSVTGKNLYLARFAANIPKPEKPAPPDPLDKFAKPTQPGNTSLQTGDRHPTSLQTGPAVQERNTSLQNPDTSSQNPRNKGPVAPDSDQAPLLTAIAQDFNKTLALAPKLPEELKGLELKAIRLVENSTDCGCIPPEGPYQKAFATFEPDSNSKTNPSPRGGLYLLGDPSTNHWTKTRRQFVDTIIEEGFWLPGKDPNVFKLQRWIDGQSYFAVWNGRCLYFFETDNAADFLPPSDRSKTAPRDADFRLQKP